MADSHSRWCTQPVSYCMFYHMFSGKNNALLGAFSLFASSSECYDGPHTRLGGWQESVFDAKIWALHWASLPVMPIFPCTWRAPALETAVISLLRQRLRLDRQCIPQHQLCLPLQHFPDKPDEERSLSDYAIETSAFALISCLRLDIQKEKLQCEHIQSSGILHQSVDEWQRSLF